MAPVKITTMANVNHLSLSIPERQVLVRMEEEEEAYWCHILFFRLEGARWVTADPHLTVSVDDLQGEEVVPVVPGTVFPAAGRPLLAFGALSEIELVGLRLQASQLAEIHGVTVSASNAATASAVWIYADTAHAQFGQEVALDLIGNVARTRLWGASALVQLLDAQAETTVTFAERVMPADRESWMREKREGAGRDKRLLSVAPDKQGKVLFRDAASSMSADAVPNTRVFEGPSALREVVKAIVSTGLEPQAYIQHWTTNSGISPKSGLATEMMVLVFSLYSMVCWDRLDATQLVTGEHLARRFIQIQRAVQKSPKSPEFLGLELYTRHMAEIATSAHTPSFDKFVATTLKDESLVMKQTRIAREETEADDKNKKKKNAPPPP